MAMADIETRLSNNDLPWRTCAVCHALAQMEPEDAARLRRLLGDTSVKFKTLEASLAEDPDTPSIPWDALSRHARAGCSARERLR